MYYLHLHLYWIFAAKLLQHTLYQCRLSIDPFKVRADLGNLKSAAKIRNHDLVILYLKKDISYELFISIDYVISTLK